MSKYKVDVEMLVKGEVVIDVQEEFIEGDYTVEDYIDDSIQGLGLNEINITQMPLMETFDYELLKSTPEEK